RRFDDLPALARAAYTHLALAVGGGVVVANPIPAADEMPLELYEHAIGTAIGELERGTVRGRDVTPRLLERMRQLTGSASVTANRSLLLHNARVAARLAVEMSAL